MIKASLAFLFLLVFSVSATAQDNFWVQIEARPALASAEDRVRGYDGRLDDVHGFYLGDGFYGILLGPFDRQSAETTRLRLLGSGQIPADSFVRNGRLLQQRFWPNPGALSADEPESARIDPAATPLSNPLPRDPVLGPDETVAAARASEAELSAPAREELQKALRWAGFYNAAIDGAIGRGTRAAMQDWQIANGLDPTGVLTTRQRGLLLGEYNAVLAGLDMRLVRDDASGIQMQIPTGVVAFSEYQPPFVKFEPTGDIPKAQVLLISQSGGAERLAGLFEVLQILEVVPPEGARTLNPDGFVIEAVGEGLHTSITVTLQDGAIKGFALVWPQGDDERRSRLIDAMQSSFTSMTGVLDPDIVPASDSQSIDMVAGLSIRQPRLSRSGFYVSSTGDVVTTPEGIAQCERITLDRDHDAELVMTDADLGIAVLRPLSPLAPLDVAAFQTALPRLQDRIAVAGYPFDGALNAATLTFGEVVDIRNLTGDSRFNRLALSPQPGDAGGPVLNYAGAVLGMLLPRQDGNSQVLPPDVHFSANAAQIAAVLEAQGITPVTVGVTAPMTSVALARRAADIAVLVSCW